MELDTVIARPIDNVFVRLIDLSDYSRWMPRLGVFIRSGQTSKGPVGVWTTYILTPLVAWMARAERGRTVRALRDSLEQGR